MYTYMVSTCDQERGGNVFDVSTFLFAAQSFGQLPGVLEELLIPPRVMGALVGAASKRGGRRGRVNLGGGVRQTGGPIVGCLQED